MKKLICLILALTLCTACFCACSKNDKVTGDVKVVINVKDYGSMEFELYPDIAPITVQNFVDLANDKFYDGLTIHRVSKNFVIQGGDPEGTGMGGSGKTIKGEFSANGVKNDLSHTKGVISMAHKSYDMDSATSQFFICTTSDKSSALDGQYAGFGKLISGEDVLDKLNNAEAVNEKPTTKIVIESVRVITDANT